MATKLLDIRAADGLTANTIRTNLDRTSWTASARVSGGGAASSAIDGNNGTRWATGAVVVITGPTQDWFKIDLGAQVSIAGIIDNNTSFTSDIPLTGDIQTSTDDVTYTTQASYTSSDISGGILTKTFTPVTARYLKWLATGFPTVASNWWSIGELNITTLVPGIVPRVGGACTFSRLAAQHYTDSSGTLQTSAFGTVSVDYPIDPISGLRVATYQLEEGRTNSFLHSQIESGWTKNAASMGITQSAATGPDGVANSAVKIVEGTTNTLQMISQTLTGISQSTAQCIDVSLKASTRTWAVFYTDDAGSHPKYSFVDLSNGTVGTKDAAHTIRIYPLSSSWYRIILVYTTPALSGLVAGFGPSDADNHTTYTGDGVSGIFAYGAGWAKDQAYDTSPIIPTTTVAVARAADSCSFAYTSVPQQQTIWVDFYEWVPQGSIASQRVFQIGDSSSANGPSLSVRRGLSPNEYVAIHHNGTSTVTGHTGALVWAVGDHVILRIILNIDGSIQIGATINGAAEVLGAASGALTLNAAWNQLVITLGADYNASNKASQKFCKVQSATGVLTTFPDVIGARNWFGTRRGVRQAA